MSLGLDLGNSRFRSVRDDRTRMLARHAAASYCMVANSQEIRDQLDKLGITWASAGSELILMGDSAVRWASPFGASLKRLLPGGRLIMGDPINRQILQVVIDMVIPPPRRRGEFCCLTLPGPIPLIDETESTIEATFFAQLSDRRGYRPILVTPGLATVLAEFQSEQFTGMGLTLGASCCDLSIVRQGREILQVRIPEGLDRVDEEFARQTALFVRDIDGQRALDLGAAIQTRHRLRSLLRPESYQEELLTNLYTQWLAGVIEKMGKIVGEQLDVRSRHQTWNMVCVGGATQMNGFEQVMQSLMGEANWPFAGIRTRMAQEPLYAVARGCLIHAELETVTARRSAAA